MHHAFIHLVLALILAPLLNGVVNRVKAVVAGRKGPPLGQLYWDLLKLARKGAVYSRTTTWIFRAGPLVGLAAVLACSAITPLGGASAWLALPGDFVVFAYLLGLMRFFTVMAALDTGSSFEGMGASREAAFSALAEPALLLGLAALAKMTAALSLSRIFFSLSDLPVEKSVSVVLLVASALLIVLLVENARIPVDDPNTHLELTMIHEVMVLDHGGPDLAMIQYGAACKLWLMGALLINTLLPLARLSGGVNGAAFYAGMLLLGVAIGSIESAMARLRLIRVPQFIVGAGVLSAFAFILILR